MALAKPLWDIGVVMLGFWNYYARIVAQVWVAIRQNVVATGLTICGAIAGAAILAWSGINPSSQTWIRVGAAAAFPIFVFAVYLLVHAIRAPWKLHVEHARVATDALEKSTREGAEQLCAAKEMKRRLEAEIESLKALIGRPSAVLRFEEVPRKDPLFEDGTYKTFSRESEFVARNGSGSDVYGVYLKPITIGPYTVCGGVPIDIPEGQEVRIEYSVFREEDGHHLGVLKYAHNIRPLLDEEFTLRGCESRNEMLQIPITITYKNAIGRSFETNMTLRHCPGMHRGPFIAIDAPPEYQADLPRGSGLL